MELGRFGIWTSYRALGDENVGAAARTAERLGYGTLWLGGSPSPQRLKPMLEATTKLTLATAITNVWSDAPEQAAAEFAELERDHPGRVLLGIGIGHPEATSDYEHPLKTMREYLDGLDGAATPVPSDRRCIAALGPKMLDLSAERTLGTHPYFVPVDHTRYARERLGPSALIAPELACVVDTDKDRAREAARKYAALYLNLRNYTGTLLRLGFTEQDIADGGSDRLLDAVVPQGSAVEIAAVVRDHIDAGADHVCLQTVGVKGIPEREWSALAQALSDS